LVTSTTDDGFEVETRDSNDPQGEDYEEIPGQGLGEGYLMWRCSECGKMGELDDGIPSECPNCGAPEEALSEVQED
jgi:rubrerythrin